MDLAVQIIVILVQIGLVMGLILLNIAYLTYWERKILGFMQDRLGPMEVGHKGLLQPIADGLKLFFKEDIIPSGANKIIFTAAPILVLVPALIGFAVVPFGRDSLHLFGIEFNAVLQPIQEIGHRSGDPVPVGNQRHAQRVLHERFARLLHYSQQWRCHAWRKFLAHL
jgi:NADH:ubiquinone oxidoreductase subunit H